MCAKCHFRLAIVRDGQVVAWSGGCADYTHAVQASLLLRRRGYFNHIHTNTRGLSRWWDAHRGLVVIVDDLVAIKYLPAHAPARRDDL